MANDRRGREFVGPAEACTHAFRRAPSLLSKILRPEANTYLGTEISDGERIRGIVRGKITRQEY
jgi:hypothetical protein